jgi:hypothetical protein
MSADSRRYAEEATKLVAGSAQVRVAWWRSQRKVVDFDSEYGRSYWLPIVGPTCYLLARSLGSALGRMPDTAHSITVPTSRMAESLGIGESLGPHAPLVRSIARLALFDLAMPDDGVLMLCTGWPLLSHRQHRRLPAWLAEQHGHDLARLMDTRRSA